MIDIREETVADVAKHLVSFSEAVSPMRGLSPLSPDQAVAVAESAYSMAVLLGRASWVDVWDLSIGNEFGDYLPPAEETDLEIPF